MYLQKLRRDYDISSFPLLQLQVLLVDVTEWFLYTNPYHLRHYAIDLYSPIANYFLRCNYQP